ncbi:MAG TPA: hypothetical protein VK213_05320 [Bacteroidales bacterium]|nr:hypothetical protein [Bacteroidales bacterium]
MKNCIIIFSALILIMSCEKYDNTCNCDNPLEDLPWLKDLKSSFTNCTCQISIFQATYNKKTVFYAALTDPLCNSYYPVVIRDCKGDTLKVYEPSLGTDFNNEVTDRKLIFNCKD